MATYIQAVKSEKQDDQARYKAHHAFGDSDPDFMHMALAAINSWERGEATLAHAVGLALKEAWAMGSEGRSPEVPKDPVVVMVRRQRTPAPPARSMVRRSR